MAGTVVIANPSAGSAEQGARLARRAEELGWAWQWSRSATEAMRLARGAAARGVERVVAAGGDGTVHCVVQGILLSSERPILAVLPMGTGNDLARTLGLGLDPERVIELLAQGTEVRAIDLARARVGRHRRVLVNGSAGGFSGEVDRAIDARDKARWGAWAYVRGALEVMGDLHLYRLTLDVDGERVEDALPCVGLTVTNGRTCGGGLRVAPAADLEDGMLDVLVVEHAGTLALAALAAQLRAGRVLGNRLARHHLGGEIVLRSDPPMPLNVDGEILGDAREARFEVLPRELPVAIGPEYACADRPLPALEERA